VELKGTVDGDEGQEAIFNGGVEERDSKPVSQSHQLKCRLGRRGEGESRKEGGDERE